MELFDTRFCQKEFAIQGLEGIDNIDSMENPLGQYKSGLMRIEILSRIVCCVVSNPLPYSRQYLTFAVACIKCLLAQISLTELVLGNSDINDTTSVRPSYPTTQYLEKLDKLLSSQVISNSLPTLKQAVRYFSSKDQQEIFYILEKKLRG